MDINRKDNIHFELRAWRKTIINRFLIISAIAAAVGTVMTMVDAFSRPEQWTNVFIYFSLVILLIVLAIFRKLDNRIRAGGVLLVAYITGLNAFASLGLGGSGRLYMLALPVIALILLGVRSGIVMSVISIITLGSFAVLFGKTTLLQGIFIERNTLQFSDWIAESSDTLMLLLIIMIILILFYRFQERVIDKGHVFQAELISNQVIIGGTKPHTWRKRLTNELNSFPVVTSSRQHFIRLLMLPVHPMICTNFLHRSITSLVN